MGYNFLEVVDSDEVLSRIGIWQLEGQEYCTELLPFALNARNIGESIVVITLDLSKPWTLADSLVKWIRVLENHIRSLRLARHQQEDLCKSRLLLFS